MAKEYTVTVQFPEGIYAETRTRAGIVVHRVNGYTGELTAEQLKAIKRDRYLTVVEAGAQAPADDQSAEATKLVEDAKAEAAKITAEAKAKGEDIVKSAKDLAKDITDKAKEDAKATTDAAKAAGTAS